jgi:hypothetical protein
VAKVAALWEERRREGPVSVSAPSNGEARDISAAMREIRRKAGELGPDIRTLKAIDQRSSSPELYDLPVAIGDHLRLFQTTPATFRDGRRAPIGRNGSVVELVAMDATGMTLRNEHGGVGKVAWERLRHRETGRVMVNYGDCLTVFSSASMTTKGAHINALPSGSAKVRAGGAYVAESRAKGQTLTVVSEGAEIAEVRNRRPLGDQRAITERDVLTNIARNMTRADEKSSAVAFTEASAATGARGEHTLRRGFRREECRRAGLAQSVLPERLAERRIERQLAALRSLARHALETAERIAPIVERLRPQRSRSLGIGQ